MNTATFFIAAVVLVSAASGSNLQNQFNELLAILNGSPAL